MSTRKKESPPAERVSSMCCESVSHSVRAATAIHDWVVGCEVKDK